MYRIGFIAGVLLWLLSQSTLVFADSVTVDLPVFANAHLTSGDAPLTASFDVGAQFSSIDSIVVKIKGHARTGVGNLIEGDQPNIFPIDPTGNNPPPVPNYTVTPSPFLPELIVSIPNGTELYLDDLSDIQAGADPTEFTSEITLGPPRSLWIDGLFDGQFDGTGEIQFENNERFFTVDWSTYQIAQHSQIDITSVQITYNGTLVPEPAAATLMLAGLFAGAICFRRQLRAVAQIRFAATGFSA